MTVQTTVLIKTLIELGAEGTWSCNIFSTKDRTPVLLPSLVLRQGELPKLQHERVLNLDFLAVFGEAEVLLSLPSLQPGLEDSLLAVLNLQEPGIAPPRPA